MLQPVHMEVGVSNRLWDHARRYFNIFMRICAGQYEHFVKLFA